VHRPKHSNGKKVGMNKKNVTTVQY